MSALLIVLFIDSIYRRLAIVIASQFLHKPLLPIDISPRSGHKFDAKKNPLPGQGIC